MAYQNKISGFLKSRVGSAAVLLGLNLLINLFLPVTSSYYPLLFLRIPRFLKMHFTGISYFSLMLIAMLLYKGLCLDEIKSFYKNWRKHMDSVLLYLLLCLFFNAIAGGILSLFTKQPGSNEAAVYSAIQTRHILMLLAAVVFAPVYEELIFRGMLFSAISDRSRTVACFVSSFVFGLYHIFIDVFFYADYSQMVYILPYFLFGFALSLSYVKANNIIVPILIHSFTNLVVTANIFLRH